MSRCAHCGGDDHATPACPDPRPHTDAVALLKLADPVENIAASTDNPTKQGFFVRYIDAKHAEYATKLGCHTTPIDNLRQAASQGSAGGDRGATIEECARHLEREADIATNSLHCGDNSGAIAATHRISRTYYEAAKSIRAIKNDGVRIEAALSRPVPTGGEETGGAAQAVQVPCPVCGSEAIHALDVLKRTIIREPEAWDAPHNRSYEPVETLAKVIYDTFVYDGPSGTKKPAWTNGGNGTKQDEARDQARGHLRQAGHSPSVPSAHRGGET